MTGAKQPTASHAVKPWQFRLKRLTLVLQTGSIYQGLSAQHLALFRIFLLSFWVLEVGRSSLPRLSSWDPAWYVAHGPWLVVPRALYPFFFDGPGLN